jgi:hypothetical protein
MDEVEVTKKKMLEILKSIKTLDDLKVQQDAFLGTIEESSRNALQLFRNLTESSASMPPEEIEKELTKFLDERTFLSDEIGQEFDRIDKIPGAAMYIQSLMETSMEQTASLRGEFLKMLPKLIEKLESREGGMTPTLRAMIDKMRVDSGPPPPPGPGAPVKKERVKVKELELIYNVKSIEDLQRDKDKLLEIFEGMLKENINELQAIKKAGISGKDAKDKLDEIENRLELFEPEMDIEMERLSQLPDAQGYIQIFHEEMEVRLKPLAMEMEELLEELRG